MNPKSIVEYTSLKAKRYKKAKKSNSENLILNKHYRITGYHRKHAIRKISNYKFFIKPKHKKPEKNLNTIILKF